MNQDPTKLALKNTTLIIIFTALIAEGIGMLILHQTKTPHNNLVLLDSLLIVVFLVPVLYCFVYIPLNDFVKISNQLSDEKDQNLTAINKALNKICRLNLEREETIEELNKALTEIKTLRGILPICASCKKIRDDQGYWSQIEAYVKEHSDADFTHSICPDCAEKLYPEFNPYKPKDKPVC